MSRLPTVGGDNGGWGAILNDYMSQTLSTDGRLLPTVRTNGTVAFTAIGGQSNIASMHFQPTATSTTQQAGLHIRMDGVATGGASIFRLAEAIEAQTGGGVGANGAECLNLTVQQNSADDVAFLTGIELAFNNLKRNDPLNPVDQNHYGMTIDAYGGFSIGPAALAIRRGGGAGSGWQRGLWIPVNAITTGTGFAIAYDGNGAGRAFTVDSSANVAIGNALSFPTAGVTPTVGPVIWNNGGSVFNMACGTDSYRWYSNNLGTELMRMSNTGTLTLGTYGSGGGAVSVGAADSGGAGFRLLRVPN